VLSFFSLSSFLGFPLSFLYPVALPLRFCVLRFFLLLTNCLKFPQLAQTVFLLLFPARLIIAAARLLIPGVFRQVCFNNFLRRGIGTDVSSGRVPLGTLRHQIATEKGRYGPYSDSDSCCFLESFCKRPNSENSFTRWAILLNLSCRPASQL